MGWLDDDGDAVAVAIDKPIECHDMASGQERTDEIHYRSCECLLHSRNSLVVGTTAIGFVRPVRLVRLIHQGWRAACASGNDCDALGDTSGYPNYGRILAGLRGDNVVRRRRSQEHASRDRRAA